MKRIKSSLWLLKGTLSLQKQDITSIYIYIRP